MSEDASSRIAPLPPWVVWGFIELTKEIREKPGLDNNPRILSYHEHTTLKATSDEVPWCSSALCCAMHEIGLPSPRSAAARSWLGWGTSLQGYQFGAIAIFARGQAPGAGHVGIAVREKGDQLLVLGGNQGDAWSLGWYGRSSLLGFRWPNNYDPEEYYFLEALNV